MTKNQIVVKFDFKPCHAGGRGFESRPVRHFYSPFLVPPITLVNIALGGHGTRTFDKIVWNDFGLGAQRHSPEGVKRWMRFINPVRYTLSFYKSQIELNKYK